MAFFNAHTMQILISEQEYGYQFGSVVGQIAVGQVRCTGLEEHLADCPAFGHCTTTHYAAVRCYPPTGILTPQHMVFGY